MTIDLYPPIVHEGDLSPDAVGEEIDEVCKKIHDACKGWGTDESKLLKAMASLSPEDRCKVAVRYEEVYGKELKAVMKSECGSRDFGTALQLLAVPPDVTECDIIRMACKGLGTDELLLYPVVCGRSNKEMQMLRKRYFEVYTKDLGQTLDSELGGDFEKIIFTCLQGLEEEYDPEFHTDDKVKEDVEKLHKMGEGKWGTDETGLFKVLCAAPPKHLKKVNLEYAEKHGNTLFKVLEKELSGKIEDATLFMLGMKLRPYETIAKLIIKACKGIGTNETLLTSTIIRYQYVLPQVKAAYMELEGHSLQDLVKKEVRGDYEKLLVAICDNA